MNLKATSLAILALLFLLFAPFCFASDAVEEVVNVLIISCHDAKWRSNILLPSIIVSLIVNQPINNRVNLMVIGDKHVYDFLNLCLPNLKRHIDISISMLHEHHSPDLEMLMQNHSVLQDRYLCAAYKLDILDMTPVDKVLVLDFDVIVQEDLSHLWGPAFTAMAATDKKPEQFMAMALEVNKPSSENHTIAAINSGVILFNLKAMRARNMSLRSFTDLWNFSTPLRYGDQDIFNVWYFKNRDRVHILPCEWNKRKTSGCPEESGSLYTNYSRGILHGSGGAFEHGAKVPLSMQLLHRHHFDAYEDFACNPNSEVGTKPWLGDWKA